MEAVRDGDEMSNELSPLARQVPGVRDPALGRVRTVWGVLLHTTGGGVTDVAKKKGIQPIDEAIDVYIASQNGSNGYKWGGPHYVIEHDGTIHQVAPDNILTAHAGGPHRAQYLDGSWVPKVSHATALQWVSRHPLVANPYQPFPSTSPNDDYVGIEMIPIGDGFGGAPMAAGLRFTLAQHDAAIQLARDIGARHALPLGWGATARLTGHEDVDPIERSDAGGGWDPGFLRASPYFDFAYVRRGVIA